MITFFDAHDENEAIKIFNEIETWAKESVFPPIKKFCAKLRKKWVYIATTSCAKFRLESARDSTILFKALKRRVYGFRNMNYFMLKIMQVCGLMSSMYLDLSGNWTPAGLELIGPQA